MAVTLARLEAYAAVIADLNAGVSRERALEKQSLDDDAFSALEEEVEGALSRALDSAEDGIPPFVHQYETVMRRAQEAALGETPLSLAEFAQGVGALSRSNDPRKALERLGLSPMDLVRALGKWGAALPKDAALAAEFEAIRSGKKPGPARSRAVADAPGIVEVLEKLGGARSAGGEPSPPSDLGSPSLAQQGGSTASLRSASELGEPPKEPPKKDPDSEP
ncbi:MAG: hypothetical protein U0271_37465 [Polyangiaceae bacterium]